MYLFLSLTHLHVFCFMFLECSISNTLFEKLHVYIYFKGIKVYYYTPLGKNTYDWDLCKKINVFIVSIFSSQKHMQHHLIQIRLKITENCNIPSISPSQIRLFSIFRKAKANKLNLLNTGKSKWNQWLFTGSFQIHLHCLRKI